MLDSSDMLDSEMLDSNDKIEVQSDDFIGRIRADIWKFLDLFGHAHLSEEDLTDEQLEAVIDFIAGGVAHFHHTGELDIREFHEGVRWVIDRHGERDTSFQSYRLN